MLCFIHLPVGTVLIEIPVVPRGSVLLHSIESEGHVMKKTVLSLNVFVGHSPDHQVSISYSLMYCKGHSSQGAMIQTSASFCFTLLVSLECRRCCKTGVIWEWYKLSMWRLFIQRTVVTEAFLKTYQQAKDVVERMSVYISGVFITK
jgi:hypothetical protein